MSPTRTHWLFLALVAGWSSACAQRATPDPMRDDPLRDFSVGATTPVSVVHFASPSPELTGATPRGNITPTSGSTVLSTMRGPDWYERTGTPARVRNNCWRVESASNESDYEDPGAVTFRSSSIGVRRIEPGPGAHIGLRADSPRPLLPGEEVTFDFAGGVFPAFSGRAWMPQLAPITSEVTWSRDWNIPTPLRRSSGIVLRWAPVTEQQVYVHVVTALRIGGSYSTRCVFDGTSGTATLGADAFPAPDEIAEMNDQKVSVGVFNARVTGLDVAGRPVRIVTSFWQLAGYFRIED